MITGFAGLQVRSGCEGEMDVGRLRLYSDDKTKGFINDYMSEISVL